MFLCLQRGAAGRAGEDLSEDALPGRTAAGRTRLEGRLEGGESRGTSPSPILNFYYTLHIILIIK